MENLTGLKVAILIEDGFEQVEMVEPRMALDQAGAETCIVFAIPKASDPKHAAENAGGWGSLPDRSRGRPDRRGFSTRPPVPVIFQPCKTKR